MDVGVAMDGVMNLHIHSKVISLRAEIRSMAERICYALTDEVFQLATTDKVITPKTKVQRFQDLIDIICGQSLGLKIRLRRLSFQSIQQD